MDYLIPPERLARPGFVARCYRPGDGALVTEAVEASYPHLAPWMPWAKPSQPVHESERLVRTFRGRWLTAEDFVLGVFDPLETRVLGGSGFHLRHGGLDSGNAELGMWIRGDSASAGLGTALLVALLEWGFTDWPWRRLVWKCDSRNRASARVADKAGMALEATLRSDQAAVDGTRRNTLLFAALRDEWQPPG